jgi:lipid II:glycine glycyltransferase (peptidoglycan interpeptide bridge formation enzyme)
MVWKLLSPEEALESWDAMLLRLPNHSPFQSYNWGQYRRALNWEPCYWVAVDDKGEPLAMMLASLRRYPFGLGLLWSEGGPVGDLALCDKRLQVAIKETTGLKRIYCRFRCDRNRTTEDSLRLTAQGWTLPWAPLQTCYSMILDLNQDEDQLLSACDRNWRRNLRRAHETKLRVSQWLDPTVEDVLAVYTSMQSLKDIEEQLSRREIEEILKNLRKQLVLYCCTDESGEVVSLLGCVVTGDQACAVFWATSEAGRKLNASYSTFWAVVQHCRRIGVKSYDLAGIDPVRNHGVYRFKRATGAKPIEYLGEWDWANRSWLRWFGNWAIARRTHLNWSKVAAKSQEDPTLPPHVVAHDVRASC